MYILNYHFILKFDLKDENKKYNNSYQKTML